MSSAVSAVQTRMMYGDSWTVRRERKGDEVEEHLDYEVEGNP